MQNRSTEIRIHFLIFASIIAITVLMSGALNQFFARLVPSPTTAENTLSVQQVERVRVMAENWRGTPQFVDRFNALEARLIDTQQSEPKDMERDDLWGLRVDANGAYEKVGIYCGGCHSLDIVVQQRASRARWEELLVWMQEKQGMPPLQSDDETAILDYLAAEFGN